MTEEEAKYLMKLPFKYRKVRLNYNFYKKCEGCSNYTACIEKRNYSLTECGEIVKNGGIGHIRTAKFFTNFPLLITAESNAKTPLPVLYEEIDSLMNIEPLKETKDDKRRS